MNDRWELLHKCCENCDYFLVLIYLTNANKRQCGKTRDCTCEIKQSKLSLTFMATTKCTRSQEDHINYTDVQNKATKNISLAMCIFIDGYKIKSATLQKEL